MSASTSGPSADCGCEPVPAAGYQGVENQLYRVEIHQGGDESDGDVQMVAGERLGRLGGHRDHRLDGHGRFARARTPTSASKPGSGSS